jgi:hypothetical protein
VAYAEYAAWQRFLALGASAKNSGMYEPVIAEHAPNACCGHLLTTIGVASLYPSRPADQRDARARGPSLAFGDVTRASMFRL